MKSSSDSKSSPAEGPASRDVVRTSGALLRGVVSYYRSFYRDLGNRLHLFAVLCLIGSLAESLAITSFIPLLSQNETGGGKIEMFFSALLNFFHLPEGFTGLLILIAILGSVRVGVNFLQLICRSWLTSSLERDLRSLFCELIEAADYRFIASQSVGYFNNLFSVEITRNVGSLNKLSEVLSGMIFAGTFLTSALFIDWRLTLAAGSIGVVGLFALRGSSARIQAISKRTSEVSAEMQSLVLQYLNFFKYLKATATTGRVRGRAARSFEVLRKLKFQSSVTSESVRFLTQMTLVFSIVGILFLLVEVRGFEVAAVLVLAMLFYKSLQQIMVVQEKWQVFCSVSGSVNVVADAMKTLDEAAEFRPEGVAGRFSDSIEFNNVSFRYDQNPILKNVDLRIEKNQTVGIVGESGAGKSTLVDLITGILSPTEGIVYFDGQPYGELSRDTLRSQFGYVLQDPVVFSDTIAANISLWEETGGGEDRRAEIQQAAKMSHAAAFIDDLEAGYDTNVGDRGTRLSGGQRQRLAIAREVYKDAPIVVFDEATSSLDSATEAAVQEGIVALSGERTVIIVAHRLSTLRHCDVIYVLAAGELVESGKWDELIQRDASFARMCRDQGLI